MANKKAARTLQVLTKEEQARLLLAVQGESPRDYAILMFMLQTGVRVGEVVGLIFDDILIQGHIKDMVTVRGEISKFNKDRDIPLSKKLKDSLQEYITWLQQRITTIKPEFPLFQQHNRIQALSTRQVERIVKHVSGQALGRSIHPHLLRHTFGTNLLRVTNIRVVQVIMGHTNIASTQIYLHPNSEDVTNAVDRLG